MNSKELYPFPLGPLSDAVYPSPNRERPALLGGPLAGPGRQHAGAVRGDSGVVPPGLRGGVSGEAAPLRQRLVPRADRAPAAALRGEPNGAAAAPACRGGLRTGGGRDGEEPGWGSYWARGCETTTGGVFLEVG